MSIAMDESFTNLLLPSGTVGGASLCASEMLQRKHYNQIAHEYEAHYGDLSSREYRRRFIYEPMFAGIDVGKMKVLDAMCGSGHTTEYLLSQGARVTGLDISEEEINRFRTRWPDARGLCRSLLDSTLDSNSFDCVTVVGGLHHVHPHVNTAIREIHRVLKPGGYFCFMEPHSGSIPDVARRVWYKFDRLFSDNEAAIDVRDLRKAFANDFVFNRTTYQGNIAFLFVLNSMIFRMPLRAKRFYSPALMAGEAALGRFQNKLTACFAIAQWQKK
jgi:SAM-dependent methyltransferase